MKTRVDNIFRKPLTYKSSSPTSIFRRHNNNNNQQQQPSNSSESESYVISCPATPTTDDQQQQQWPPHQLSVSSVEVCGAVNDKSTTLSSSQSPSTPNKLDRCNPLPTHSETGNSFNVQSIFGTTDSFNIDKSSPDRSPLSSSKRSLRSLSNSSRSPKQGTPKGSSSSRLKKIKPPSYYKLQFSKSQDKASLTSGDDSSVQIDDEHNLQIRLATTNDCCDSTVGESSRSMREERQRVKISRASPICEDTSNEEDKEEEGIEYDALNNVVITPDFGSNSTTTAGGEGKEKMKHKWTVNSQGQIIIVPPSPTHIASEQLITKKARHHSPVKEMNLVPKAAPFTDEQPATTMTSSINQPILMTVSNDSSSNSSFISSGEEETLEGTTFLTPLPTSGSGGSSNLESPPRMTRHSRAFGTAYHSLFRGDESDGSRSSGNNAAANKSSSLPTSGKRRQRSISPNNSKGSKTSDDGGGCTSILTQILDVFSLNANMCCHQEVGSNEGVEGNGDYLRQHSQQAQQRGVLICA